MAGESPTPEQPTSPPPAPSGEGSQTSPQPDTVPAQQGRPASLKIHDERRDLGIPLEAYKKSAEFKRADAYLGDKFADDKIASHLPKNTGENDDQYRKRKLGEIDKRVRDSEAYSGDDWVKQILMGENHPDLRELARTIEAHFTTMRQEEQQRMIEDLRTQFAENRPNTVLTQVGELGVRDQAEGPYVAYYLDDEGKPREMLREARQDFLAFRLIEDRLADVEDPTLMTAFPEKRYPGVGIVITDIANTLKQEGKPPSYRNMIQSLRERLAKPQSAEDRFTTKLTYAEVRGRFYRNIKEALQHKRNVDTAPAGASTADLSTLTPVALDMADILKEIDFSKPGLETMIDNYQGFNQDIGKQKLQEQMKGEIDALSLHLFLLALKGEERFERGVKTPIKLERNPQVTRKRFIEGGTQEPTGGGRTPPEKKGPGPDTTEPPTGPVEPPIKEEGPPGDLPPGPTKDGEKPPPPTLPTELVSSVVSEKQKIKEAGEKGKENQQEVMAFLADLVAVQLGEERRKEWEAKGFRPNRIIRRLWQSTFAAAGLYDKDRKNAMKLMAQTGINTTALPVEFIHQLDDVIDARVRGERGRGLRRATGWARDRFHDITSSETEREQRRVQLVGQLRQVMEEEEINQPQLSQQSQDLLNQNGMTDLYNQLKTIVTGDYAASQAVAKRLTDSVRQQFEVHTDAGESRLAQQLVLEGPMRDFYIDRVLTPLLREGIAGTLNNNTYLGVQREMQEFFFSKKFLDWYDAQSKNPDFAQNFRLSLSYGSDLVKVFQEVYEPQLSQMKEVLQTNADIDNYLKDVVLKVNVGTLLAETRGELGHTLLERLAAQRGPTHERVLQLYQQIRDGRTGAVVPDMYLSTAGNRALLLQGLIKAQPIGWAGGVFLGTKLGEWGGKTAGSFIGGGLVAGAGGMMGGIGAFALMRGAQEWERSGVEIQHHNVEEALGYTFAPDARRRNELARVAFSKRGMAEITQQFETTAPQDSMRVMALISDVNARFRLMGERGIDLFKVDNGNTQGYQRLQTDMESSSAGAQKQLVDYLNANQPALDTMRQQLSGLGVTTQNLTSQQLVEAGVNLLTDTLAANLETGADNISQNLQTALGDRLIANRREAVKNTIKRARNQRILRATKAGVTTLVLGGAGAFATREAMNLALEVATKYNPLGIGDRLADIGAWVARTPVRRLFGVDLKNVSADPNPQNISIGPGQELEVGVASGGDRVLTIIQTDPNGNKVPLPAPPMWLHQQADGQTNLIIAGEPKDLPSDIQTALANWRNQLTDVHNFLNHMQDITRGGVGQTPDEVLGGGDFRGSFLVNTHDITQSNWLNPEGKPYDVWAQEAGRIDPATGLTEIGKMSITAPDGTMLHGFMRPDGTFDVDFNHYGNVDLGLSNTPNTPIKNMLQLMDTEAWGIDQPDPLKNPFLFHFTPPTATEYIPPTELTFTRVDWGLPIPWRRRPPEAPERAGKPAIEQGKGKTPAETEKATEKKKEEEKKKTEELESQIAFAHPDWEKLKKSRGTEEIWDNLSQIRQIAANSEVIKRGLPIYYPGAFFDITYPLAFTNGANFVFVDYAGYVDKNGKPTTESVENEIKDIGGNIKSTTDTGVLGKGGKRVIKFDWAGKERTVTLYAEDATKFHPEELKDGTAFVVIKAPTPFARDGDAIENIPGEIFSPEALSTIWGNLAVGGFIHRPPAKILPPEAVGFNQLITVPPAEGELTGVPRPRPYPLYQKVENRPEIPQLMKLDRELDLAIYEKQGDMAGSIYADTVKGFTDRLRRVKVWYDQLTPEEKTEVGKTLKTVLLPETLTPELREKFIANGKVYGLGDPAKLEQYFNQTKEAAHSVFPELTALEAGLATGRIPIEQVSDAESQEIMGKVAIHGHSFHGDMLTAQILQQEGLAPKHKIKLGNTTVFLSSTPYNLADGRIAVVGYVEKEGQIVARTFYRSNSQGVWRYLPNYTPGKNKGDIDWYDKGYGEESVTLPIMLQQALAEFSKESAPILNVSNPNLIFAGTARDRNSPGTLVLTVEAEPKKLEGDFYPPTEDSKNKPEQLQFTNPSMSPDFNKKLTSWKQKTSLYGDVTIEVFPSKDGKLQYMFCRDGKGRAWIGGVEDDSEIQTVGLRKTWIKAGDLTTPAYEYKTADVDQTGGYGNEADRSSQYVDMFTNYLSKIPVIQEYLKTA